MVRLQHTIFTGILLFCIPALCFGQADRNSTQRAEQVMKALAAAYPERIERAAFRSGDWAVSIQGIWYYYAGGKLLPEELRSRAAEFDPQPFYNYPAELPPWRQVSPEDAERFRNMANNRSQNPPRRSQHFFDALWRAHTREESYERIKTIRFLGNPVMVHYAILVKLALVEEQILAEAARDPQVRAWVNNVSTLDSWNWRSIADTQSRSFHAYGAAIDILPRTTGGRESYWLWASRSRPEWWNISYEQRLHPPSAVIKAFESRGFIWGGKWLFFDTMHFEYRPEILILSGRPPLNFH
ncbi:MAG: M15 family metallopeptidase [Treponema sp.]|jgi:hypothetical protein|nr:M15 family metallopeptidase [Treponema sp.]